MSRGWSADNVNFKPGMLRLQTRRKTVHVWVQFYDLTLDYWHTDILLTITKGVGIPLHIN